MLSGGAKGKAKGYVSAGERQAQRSNGVGGIQLWLRQPLCFSSKSFLVMHLRDFAEIYKFPKEKH